MAFDEAGDRKYVEYEIINVRPRGGHKVQDVVQKYVNRVRHTIVVISPDESRGYIGFRSVALPPPPPPPP